MIKLTGENFYLRTVTVNDVNEEYLSWLHDKSINRFLEVRHNPPTKEDALLFVKSFNNKSKFFFGIFNNDNRMIGTISLSCDIYNKTASYGYLIGDKTYWGTKSAIEAISLLIDFAFDQLQLRKIWGGAYILNIGSIFNFKRLGFVQEGRIRAAGLIDGKEIDSLQFGLLKHEWLEFKNKGKTNARK